MSTTRREPAERIKGPDGRKLCSCGCGRVPVKPRRNWFSDACVEAWKIRNDPGHVRSLVFQRDKGICAVCGCDAQEAYGAFRDNAREVERMIQWLSYHRRLDVLWDQRRGKWIFAPYESPDHAANERERKRLRAKYLDDKGWTAGRSTGWDADHIIPVVEGGGQCGLENYRTLCHPCHKEQSRILAARLAKKRRRDRQPELLP
jgi:5-methylcytosine-specific restriction protein A